MTAIDTDAVVLRSIRYSEADVVLALYSPEAGRFSAIAKGARKSGSRLGGRLQPGVWIRVGVARGRGDLGTIRTASTVRAHAGLWLEGERLRAAGSVLETVLRAVPEHEPSPETFHLLTRTLGLLAAAPPTGRPPRLDPIVLGFQAKILVVSGLLPRLGSCAVCDAGVPLVAFSAPAGGVLCAECARGGEPVGPEDVAALVALIGHPLSEAREVCDRGACLGVERMIGLVLREHLGVTLRSATPL